MGQTRDTATVTFCFVVAATQGRGRGWEAGCRLARRQRPQTSGCCMPSLAPVFLGSLAVLGLEFGPAERKRYRHEPAGPAWNREEAMVSAGDLEQGAFRESLLFPPPASLPGLEVRPSSRE